MKKRWLVALTMGMVIFTFLLNGFTFYNTYCEGEYLESKDYHGRVQSVQKQLLAREKQILSELPEDKREAMVQLENWQTQLQERKKELRQQIKKGNEPEQKLDILTEQEQGYVEVYSLLWSGISYEKHLSEMEDYAQSLSEIAFFNSEEQEENRALTLKEYYGVRNRSFPVTPDQGVSALINYRMTDWLVLTLAVGMGILFSYAQRESMKKRMQVTRGYIWGGGILLSLVVLLLYASNGYMLQQYIEKDDLSLWVQSFEVFRICPLLIQMGSFLQLWVLMKTLVALLVFWMTFYIFQCEQKRQLVRAVVILGILVAEGILHVLYKTSAVAGNNRLAVWGDVNLFSGLHFEKFFTSFYHLELFGRNVQRLPIFFIFMAGFSAIVLLLVYRSSGNYGHALLEKVQYSYYEEMEQKYTETRQLWHDFHNHLLTIQELNRTGEVEAANQYMKELGEEMDKSHILTQSGSKSLDVLIYQKNREAMKEDTTLEIRIGANLRKGGFLDVDLCCVVGNLLDNAMEAVKKLEKEKRKATLDIQQKGEMLYISAENPYEGERLLQNSLPVTTKEDSINHGIGLKSVQRICRKYNGSMQVEMQDGLYRISTLMMAPISKEKEK